MVNSSSSIRISYLAEDKSWVLVFSDHVGYQRFHCYNLAVNVICLIICFRLFSDTELNKYSLACPFALLKVGIIFVF